MKSPISRQLIEAARLTKLGRLNEATGVIQKFLRGAVGGDASPSNGEAAGPTIDGEAIRIESPAEADFGAAVTVNGQSQRARGVTRPAPRAEVVAPTIGQFVSGVFASDAGSRTYKLYVPGSQNAASARPLVVMLHGCAQSADDFAAGTRMNFAAEKHGAFVVYPEQSSSANPSKCWNWFEPKHQQRGKGEPALIAGIVMKLIEDHNIDPRRVYIAGLSAGASAAIVAAEAYPEIFAAVGAHSGLASGAARDMSSAFAAMGGNLAKRQAGANGSERAPMPTIVFHGDRDHTVHFANAADVMDGAVAGGEFSSESQHGKTPSGRDYTRTLRRDAKGKVIVERWDLHGAGHAWSGGSRDGSFTDPAGVDATAEMLRFFLADAERR